MPVKFLLPVLKLLYKRNGLVLEDMKRVHSYYLLKVNGYYLPSESLNWFTNYKYLKERSMRISLYGYSPKNGDTVIDIGAGIGEEVIVFSELVGEKGRVIAVEANPKVFDVLSNVVQLNNLKNVWLNKFAIAEKGGLFELSLNAGSFLGGTISKDTSGAIRLIVNGVNIYQWLSENEIDKVDLLKANVEGAERFLIPDKSSQFDAIKNVAIACHDFRFKQEGDEFFRTKNLVVSFLKHQSFQVKSQSTSLAYVNDWVYGHRSV
ncbi:hypothetical protein BUE76_19915 [Cnuella takakiae]|nr:hypothetical protein BUE76_19915 [Cnuella takakiae]